MSRPAAYSNWVFTLNNYTPEHEAILQKMDYHYLLYGREVAPTTGTPHLQGYVQLKKRVRRTALVKLIPTFWEPANGDVTDQSYCKKDGDFVELGIPHSTKGAACKVAERIAINKRLHEDNIMDLVTTGAIHYSQVPLILKARKLLHETEQSRIELPDLAYGEDKKHHQWVHGPTGTGKSRYAATNHPGAYKKRKTLWWSNYDKLNPHHDVVIIEEWGPQDYKLLDELKVWADVRPFPAEIKGGDLGDIRPRKFIITSNHAIDEAFPDPKDHLPLKRRFEEIYMGPPEPAKLPGTSYATGGASKKPTFDYGKIFD